MLLGTPTVPVPSTLLFGVQIPEVYSTHVGGTTGSSKILAARGSVRAREG
jgi:hypothetical protein